MAETRVSAHRWPVRVYYEDTDAGGIVYHASYLKYAERARTEFLRTLGFDHGTLQREYGVLFAVRHLEVDYRKSAILDDELSVRSEVERAGGASLDLLQAVERREQIIVLLRVRLALLDARGRPARLPPPLRSTLTRLVAGGNWG